MIADALSSRVETIFLRVVELPENDRPSYLDDACQGDLDLRAHVEILLQSGNDALSTTQLRQAAGLTLLTTTAEVLPIRLDRYDLEERLGEGSFGVVYRAAQHTPVRRKVAVKVLRPGLDSGEIVRRFEAERQALAALDHTNIARMFDAGNTPDGRPYFVMELLDGHAFTDYCDRRRLGLRERLALFLEICSGVEHAHGRGILHRDLKPPNVLVAEIDGRASVKVIDFGIARALGAELPFGTLATEVGRLMGTPEYMSPEQMDGEPSDVDTRSDVYALGALLYETICGRLPFDSKKLRSSRLSELRRIVCEVQPPPPSRAWNEGEAGLAEACAHRSTTPPALLAGLKREIEWVPMRALRKSAAERYRSVAELADDVRNYLGGRPLMAGPDSAAYRARKFIRRHRAPIIAAVSIVLLLVAAVVGTTIGMLNARQQRMRAELQLADTLIVRGQYATDQLLFVDAWDAFAQARTIHRHFGKITLPSELGMYGVLAQADPPAAILKMPPPGRPWLAFVDGGRTLISSGTDSTIEWDVAARLKVREYPFQVLALSPDEKTLFALQDSRQPVARDRATQAIVTTFPTDAGDAFNQLTVSQDGRWLIGMHTYHHFSVWDAHSGVRKGKFKPDTGGPAAAICPVNSDIAIFVGPADMVVEWDLANCSEVRRFKLIGMALKDVDLSADGKTIALATWEGVPLVVDLVSGKIVHSLGEHRREVHCVAFSPDGKWVVSAAADASVCVWEASTGKLHRRMFGHRQPVWSIAFGPNSARFASASVDGEIRMWDLDAPAMQFDPPHDRSGKVLAYTLSADDRLFIRKCDDDEAAIEVWDLETRQRLSTGDLAPAKEIIPTLQFVSDGEKILALQLESPGAVLQWDARKGGKAQVLVRHGGRTRGFFSSPDLQRIFTFDDRLGLRAWDVQSGTLLWERAPPKPEWTFYNASPDMRFIAKLNDGGSVEILRSGDGSLVRKFNTVTTPSGHALVRFVPGSQELLVWAHYSDTRPRLMNFVTGQELWLAGAEQRQRSDWYITADGKMLAVIDGERQLHFVDMATGKFLFTATMPSTGGGWNLSQGQTRLSYTTPDGRVIIADLTFGPKLAESDQLRPTDGQAGRATRR